MGLKEQYKQDSHWLKAEDLEAGELVLTISSVGESKFQDGRTQPTLGFEETEKILGLNKTNQDSLAELFGGFNERLQEMDVEAEELIGKQIRAFRSKTKNPSGATVPCVRIGGLRPAKAAAAPTAPTAPADYKPKGQSNDLPAQQMRNAAREAAKGARKPPAEDDDADPFDAEE